MTASDAASAAGWRDATLSTHRDAAANLSVLGKNEAADILIKSHVAALFESSESPDAASSAASLGAVPARQTLLVGLAALHVFLQANVTGPVVPADELAPVQARFASAWAARSGKEETQPDALLNLQKACLARLEVDGVSPYAHIPHLELFSLARYIFMSVLDSESTNYAELPSVDAQKGTHSKHTVSWIRLRISIWHYKLLTQPSLGPGSNFTKSSQWSEVPTLVTAILEDMKTVRGQLASDEVWSEAESWSPDDRACFLLEAANTYILLGRHEQAKDALKEAAQVTGLTYALSGALGKRTKFQENSVSQLVVLARSSTGREGVESHEIDEATHEEKSKPEALQLNDDTLLEEIEFNKPQGQARTDEKTLHPSLAELTPDSQPQLAALDQIILLTEATLKDAFSPVDKLTSEEILPYAVRVLADPSTNWQIYTQALLVRSRIEIHRSRTVERGVLQLQAVADQVLSDTTVQPEPTQEPPTSKTVEADVPPIEISPAGQTETAVPAASQVPTAFLPAPKATESAPAHVRLRYIDALSTPPRWHLESELAYAWAGVGSLTSALEIFKRLRMWAEVALCYASAAASEDEDGRGSGGDEKARAILRWRLFHATGEDALTTAEYTNQDVEKVLRFKASQFAGPERSPPPPNAARLWCILGDVENDASHYERAWAVSKQRYARAQKSLGEYHLANKDTAKAQQAYRLATSVNRLSPDLWNRLGDISLRLGQFEEAAESYSRSIGCATDTAGGEDARTWSNLGSALWSLYCEVVASQKDAAASRDTDQVSGNDGDDEDAGTQRAARTPESSSALLSKSLAAYKKGASIAHDNWRIWDNVLTLASRLQPPAVPDMVLAMTHILRIRKTEDAIDADVLAALLQDVVLSRDKKPENNHNNNNNYNSSGGSLGKEIYEPPRGSPERLVTRLVEEEIVPLITQRAELWGSVSRLRTWRRDYAGAIDASERAWRAAVGASGSSLLPGEAKSDGQDWTTDLEAWNDVVARTDELVSMLETWGPDVPSLGARWKGKARSALRSVMGRGKETWEGSDGWIILQRLMDGLKAAS